MLSIASRYTSERIAFCWFCEGIFPVFCASLCVHRHDECKENLIDTNAVTPYNWGGVLRRKSTHFLVPIGGQKKSRNVTFVWSRRFFLLAGIAWFEIFLAFAEVIFRDVFEDFFDLKKEQVQLTNANHVLYLLPSIKTVIELFRIGKNSEKESTFCQMKSELRSEFLWVHSYASSSESSILSFRRRVQTQCFEVEY